MALIGNIAISMTTNIAAFSKGIKSAGSQLASFAKSAQGIALTGLVGAGGIAGIYKLVETVGHMEQQTHRADVVFGEFSKNVIAQSKLMADAFGVPREEFVKGANSLGALFKNEGYTEEQSAKLSVGFATLAINASRLTGIPVEEVLQKIRKGAAGSGRGLQELGVFMNDDVVHAEALSLGLVKLGQDMTESAKIQARLSVISKQLGDANGQAGATANSVMGRWEAFTGRIANLAETIGNILLPIIGPGSEMQVALFGIQTLLDGVAASMTASSNTVVGGAQVQVQSFGIIAKTVGFLADAWQLLSTGFKAVQAVITAGLAAQVQALGYLASGFDKLLTSFGLAKTGASDFLNGLAKDLDDLSKNQIGELEKKLAEPWAHTQVDGWFANASEKLKTLQAQASKPALDLKAIGAPKAIVPEKKPEMKFGGAFAQGSAESTSAILRSKFGGGRSGKELEKIAAQGMEANKQLAKIADNTGRRGAGPEIWDDLD